MIWLKFNDLIRVSEVQSFQSSDSYWTNSENLIVYIENEGQKDIDDDHSIVQEP